MIYVLFVLWVFGKERDLKDGESEYGFSLFMYVWYKLND